MDIDEDTIRDRCTEAVFDRGQTYRSEGRIQRLTRFDAVVTATVQGSSLYDITVELDDSIDVQCTCPYDGLGDCKHVVAVLLEIESDPPADESSRIEETMDTLSPDDLRLFLRDALAEDPALRERFLAEFGKTAKDASAYRDDVEQLFQQHAQEHGLVFDAIDFSRLFELATQYRTRNQYRAAAQVYRGLFEGIDDNIQLVDAAYDHYANAFQSALDGYVDSVQQADTDPAELESFIAVLETRLSTGADIHRQQFATALDEFENGD